MRLQTSKEGKGLFYCMISRDAEHIHFEDVVTKRKLRLEREMTSPDHG